MKWDLKWKMITYWIWFYWIYPYSSYFVLYIIFNCCVHFIINIVNRELCSGIFNFSNSKSINVPTRREQMILKRNNINTCMLYGTDKIRHRNLNKFKMKYLNNAATFGTSYVRTEWNVITMTICDLSVINFHRLHRKKRWFWLKHPLNTPDQQMYHMTYNFALIGSFSLLIFVFVYLSAHDIWFV